MRLFPRDNSLIEAVIDGDCAKVRRLFDDGVDVNQVDEHGMTALMHAAARGDRDIVEWLLIFGTDPEMVSHNGSTALWLALKNDHDKVVILLEDKERRKSLDATYLKVSHQEELLAAIDEGSLPKARLALAVGAEAYASESLISTTPLQHAILKGNAEIVHLLLQNEAAPTRVSRKRAMDYAAKQDRLEMAAVIELFHLAQIPRDYTQDKPAVEKTARRRL